MENEVAVPLKTKLYCRCVDDIFSQRKKNIADILCKRLNNYQQNVKLTTEINPNKFFDTKLTFVNIGHLKYQNITNAMQFLVIFTEQK